MKTGRTLQALAEAVAERAARKDDLVVDTRQIVMLNGSELSLPTAAGGVMGEERIELPLAQIAHRQIGERLGIPAKFYDSLRDAERDGGPHPEIRQLLDTNVNTLFRERPARRLVRTLRPDADGNGGAVRAFLSDRYRRRDDEEVLERVVPILHAIDGGEVASCEVTDTRLYLKIVSPKVQGEVARGDYVQAGVMIRNSEVGHGSLQVAPFVNRLVCTNGMVVPEKLGTYLVGRHVGAQLQSDETLRAFSDETLRLDDEAFFAKVGDVVRMAVDETNFAAIVAEMQRAKASSEIVSPVDAVERLAQRFTLSDGEGQSVLRHLTLGGDLSAYGALNAITRSAEDVESYERASELEAIGGDVLTLTPREWEAIAA